MRRENEFHEVYISIAFNIARLSRSKRRKVGALLVKDKNIISFGYNGTPAGFANECEDEDGRTLDSVLHAESNAITKAAKSEISTKGAVLYLTFSPCYACSKLIIQSGIKAVYYADEHSCTRGLELLRQTDITVIKLEEEPLI